MAGQARATGMNRAAKLLMLEYAFETWGVRRVLLKTDARNTRSRQAIEALGAKLDGVLRAHLPAADGLERDSAVYSILAREWPECKQALVATCEGLASEHSVTVTTRQ
jgi:N-acetyltransferase